MDRIQVKAWAVRFVLFAIIIAGGLSLGQPASTQPLNGLCSETTNMLGDFHAFNGGACYQGAPNAIHGDYQVGYCHTYHYDC